MTTPAPAPENPAPENIEQNIAEEKDERKRRLWLLLLLLLLLLLCCVGYFFVRYLAKPQPVAEMVPVVNQVVYYPPTFKQVIKGVDQPVGVAVTPDGQRIYVAEAGGQRLIKVFDRGGNLINRFAPPGNSDFAWQLKYITLDKTGRVFVVDRLNNVIDIFDADGHFIDSIIGQDQTISKILAEKVPGGPAKDAVYYYEGINHILYYNAPGKPAEHFDVPKSDKPWSPLGIRFDPQGNLIYTDLSRDAHSVRIIPAASLADLQKFAPTIKTFGSQGKENGQFDFPNSAVVDSKGNFYISDGNNGRVSSWTAAQAYKTFFGFGAGEGGLNLPRGEWMDARDHLHVVDSVGSVVRVYDVSGSEPVYMYKFGGFGAGEAAFNYPTDVAIDSTGRVYVTDSSNNRIQIWSY